MNRITKSISAILFLLLVGAATFSSCNRDPLYTFATLYGFVTEQATGEPVASANVVLAPGGRTTITGANGHFEFPDLEARQYTITVQRAGFQTNRVTITAVTGRRTGVNIPLTRTN